MLLKWIEVYDQSDTAENGFPPSKQMGFKTPRLRSDLCNYSDAYIVVARAIAVTHPDNNAYDKKLAFKNNTSITSCILEINNMLINIAMDLDIAYVQFD